MAPSRPPRPPLHDARLGRLGPLLKRAGINLRRGLGQNFLLDKSVLGRIADALGAGPDDAVIEIGPGLGNLTEQLAKRAGRVLAVEIDERFRPIHQSQLGELDHVSFRYADFMQADLSELAAGLGADAPPYVAGNIPYHLTSPILFKLAAEPIDCAAIVLLMQREVAQRLVAEPGTREYGVLQAKLAVRFEMRRCFDVKPGAFLPPPRVASTLMRFTPREDGPLIEDSGEREAFFAFVDAAFAQRRKRMDKSVAGASRGQIEREAIQNALCELGIDPSVRAEALSPARLVEVFRALGAPRLSGRG